MAICCDVLTICMGGLVAGMSALVYCVKITYDVEKIKKKVD